MRVLTFLFDSFALALFIYGVLIASLLGSTALGLYFSFSHFLLVIFFPAIILGFIFYLLMAVATVYLLVKLKNDYSEEGFYVRWGRRMMVALLFVTASSVLSYYAMVIMASAF